MDVLLHGAATKLARCSILASIGRLVLSQINYERQAAAARSLDLTLIQINLRRFISRARTGTIDGGSHWPID